MADSFAIEYAKKKKELIAKNAANNSTTKGNISGNKTPYGISTNSFAIEYAKKKKELIDKGFTPKRKPTTKPSIPTASNNTKSGSAFTRMSDFMKNSVGTIRDGDNFASKTIGSTESAKNALTDLINRYNANSQMKADQQRTTGRLPVVPVEEQSNSYTSPREWLKDQKTYERGLKAMREGLDLADEASVNNYNEAVKAYNSYINDEINAYNTWRGTIRSADVVKAEIDDVNAKAKELEGAKRQLRLIESDLSNIENGIPPEFYSADEIDQEYQKIKDKISSIEKDVARLPSLQDEYAYAQAFYYGDMQKNEDWQTNSVYVPKRTEVKEEDKLDFWGQLGEVLSGNPTNESRGYATDSDLLYDAINGDEEARGILAQRNIAKSGGAEGGIASGLNLLLNQGDFQQQLYEMKPEEIATYNYLYATQGTEAANKYIYDYLNDELNLRRRLGIETAFAETAQKYPIVSSIGTIALAPVKGIGYLYQAADYLSDGEMEANAGYNSFSYMSNAVREQVSEDIDKALGSGIWGSVGSWTYNLGMSMGDFVTSTVVAGGNPTLALTIMSTGAAADYTIAAKDRGLSDGQAFALGTIAGLAEAVTEKYSLEALLKPETKKGLIYILTNALTEGTEEVSSDLINTIADLIIAADKAELRTSINEYKEVDKNMSDGEAFGLALADYAGQLGLSFLGGFISGGTISSIYGAVNSKAKKEFVESNGYMSEEGTKALIETGLSLANDTEAYKLASEIQQKLDVGERVSPKELYALIEANEIALESEEKTAQEADARLKEEAKVKEARLAQETEARLSQETEARIEARAKEQTSLHVFSPDYINEVAKQTGFGEHGTRAFLTAITNNAENRSVEQIKREMQSAYEAGRVGTPVNRIAEYLQSDMQIDAYTAGKQDALADLSKNKVQAPFATVYSPDESGLDRSIKYKGIPSRTLSIMDTIGKAFGAKVQISDTVVASTVKDNDGNDVAITANGSHTNGVIKVARDAEDPALVVIGHEGAHRMKLLAPEEYSLFENYAVETMAAKRNMPYQTLVEAYRSNATSSKIELSVGQAMEEISADFAGKLFKDPVLLQDFINEGKKPENRNWVQRFFDVIADIVNTITGKKNKAKAKAMQEVADYLGIEIEQVQKAIELWKQAYTASVEAVQTRQESSDVSQVRANQSAVKELSENGIGYDADTQTVYSLRYSPATVKDVIERQNRVESLAKMVADTTHRSIEDARKWVKAEMSIANLIMSSPDFLAVADYEADDRYEAIKSNSDYPQGTVDFVNLCPKRKEFTKIFDVLQKTYPNRLFTATDVAGMRQILSDHDIIVACGLCFVEDRRQLLGEIADTFINMWKTAIDTNSPVKKTNANGEAKIMHVTKRIADQYGVTKGASVYAKDKYVPTQYDLTTYEGFKHLQANHPTVAMTYEMYNNSRGQQAGRLIEGRAEYKRQILSWSDARVKRVNDNGGLRIFSFSDFEVEHLLDLVQVILDCSARGVKIQGYTKIPEFAKLIRDTGIKLNRSLIPKGKTGLKLVNGKTVLDIDNVEGMNMESENFLDESDNPNVGNVIVGINDEQIRVAMTDDFIDYIIPFHSNKSKAVCVALGLEGWDNYKNDQHDKNKSTGKAAKSNINIYTEVIDKYNPKNKVEFVEAFLDVCKQKNIEPRFSRFLNKDANGDYVYTEGYHKFLVDFKLFDAEGNILPQQTIVPNLDEKFMSDLIKDEATELKNYKFPQEVYDEIEAKYGKAETSDADNANLTEKSDTQFSLKGQSDLLKDNKRLRERIDELKRQMTVTTVAKVNKKQLASYTRRILNGYDSNADFDTTKEALDNLYTYIANGEADGTPPVWEEAYKQAREIARNVVEKASVLEDTDYTQYRELRDYLRKTPLVMPRQNRGDFDAYGGWNNFRKRNMAKVNLANNGVPIDSAYQELATLYPGFFNEEEYTNPVDQLLNMLDVYERLRPYEINPFAGMEDGAIAELANDIMEMFFDIPQARPTFADRQQRELTKLKAKYGKRLENMSRREMVAKILRHIQPMSQKLLRPTDKQHVPQELRNAVATLLNAINLEGKYTIDEKTGKRTASGEGKPTKRTEAFLALKQQYLEISQNESSDMVIDPALLGEGVDGTNLFDEVIAMGNIRLSDMSKEQLDTVWRVIRAVEHSITSVGRMLAQGKFETTMEAAEAIRRDTASRKGKNSLTKRHVSLDLFDPYTFFSQYGEAGHSLYRMLRDAQDKTILWTNELAERTQDIASLETRQELESEKSATTFSVAGGQLTLTKAQIMNLYLLDKRGQAKGHLVSLVGGIVQPEIGKKVKRGTDSTIVTQEDVENIINSLTDDEKAIADKYQRLTKWLAEKGNNASMQVYGYEKFNDPNYWTIISAKEQLNQTVEKGNDNPRSIKNMGSAKAINPEANNAVELLSMFDLFDKHASDMLTYSAWLAPMEDMNRLFNFKYRDEMGNITNATFKGLLNRIGGENSDQYWLNLMKDIQNGISIKTSNLGSYAWKIYGNVKAASVGYNLRVVAQQPMAYFRASILLNPVSMAQGAIKGATNGNGWSKALKYAPVALMKQMGGFEIAANQRGLSEQLNVAETKKGKLVDFIKQSPFWLAGMADEVTWGAIWNACEWEIANKQKNLEIGSELYYRAVAELFTEIVDQTQVVDGVLQRSAIMRSANTLDRQASAFMGEPIKSLNVFIRAYNDFRYETNVKKRKAALKKVARAAGTLALTNIMTAIAQSIIDAARDDDEEKDYWERFVKAYVGIGGDEGTLWDIVKSITLEGNLVETSNPATWIPYANDIVSILKGFDVERMDAGALGDVINATMQAIQTFGGEGKWTIPYAMTQVARNVAKMFGIPVNNLVRDCESIVRSIITETENWEGLYEFTNNIYNVNKETSRFLDILYQAYEAGDTEAYNAISQDLIKRGVEPSKIEQGIKSRSKKKAEEGANGVSTEPIAEEEGYSIDNLNGKQYTVYVETRGDIYDDILTDFDRMGISKLDDETEKALLDAALKYAKETALEEASGGEYDSETKWINNAQDSEALGLTPSKYIMLKEEYGATSIGAEGVYKAYEAGVDVETYLEFKKKLKDLEYEKDVDGARKEAFEAMLDSMGLSQDDYDYLFGTEYKEKKSSYTW